MENNQIESAFENNRLEQTVILVKRLLEESRERNEETKSAIITAKQELRENTVHSISNLWNGEDFEALAELNQYANPITEKITDYEEVENKIAVLEEMLQSPYFARIDFKFEDEDSFEQIYIGRASLKKDNISTPYVYDWRSPIASVFYRFMLGEVYYDAPAGRITGEVNLKRQYEINQGVLEYFFDTDIQIVDEFLRKLLSQNTSAKMKTIVETIQKEQDIVIRDIETDLMMVQGVAGSGKTSIALHRAAYFMYQGLSSKLSANNILIISPNSVFEQYISNVLPELGESNIVSAVFEDILRLILPHCQIQTRAQFLENLISGSGYRNMMKYSIEFKTSPGFLIILNRLIDDLPHRWVQFQDVIFDGRLIIEKELIKKKVLSGGKGGALGSRLQLVEEYILELLGEMKRGRLKRAERIQIKEEFLAFLKLDIGAIYRHLFHDQEYFYKLAEGIELPDHMDLIYRYTQENLESSQLFYDDAGVLAYLHLKVNGSRRYKDIRQVIIDEAQDYYPLHFEIFNLLFPVAKFTVLGDINQTLEKRADLSFYEQIKRILNKKKTTLVTMDKSFRCTNEILNYGAKFLDYSFPIRSFNRSGEQPQVYAVADQEGLNNALLDEVKTCLEQGYKSVGIICKTEKNAHILFKQLEDKVGVQLIRNDGLAKLQGVFIIPVYMSKGLEFDAVLIGDADHGNYHSEEDKKLLYIACTRALHRLNLYCRGTASLLL